MKALIKSSMPVSLYIWLQNRRDRIRLQSALRKLGTQERWVKEIISAARLALNERWAKDLVDSESPVQAIETLRREWGGKQGLVTHRDFGAAHSNGALEPSGVMHDSTFRELFVQASSTRIYATFFHQLVLKYDFRRVLELGTCVGMSGSYVASALAANGSGQLVTLEGSKTSSDIAGEIFENMGLAEWVTRIVGPFHEKLGQCLEEYGPFDMVFIDGHHDGIATVRYFNQILPHVSHSGIMIFDDIRWSDDMYNAWNEIRRHKSLVGGLDFQQIGLVMVGQVSK